MGLTGILNDDQPVLLGDGHNRVHITGIAEEMHGEDGLGARRDCRFDATRVNIIAPLVDVDKYRSSAGKDRRIGRGDEGKGGGDDLITRTDAVGQDSGVQCRGTRGRGHGVLDATDGSKSLLEGLDSLALGKLSGIDHLQNGLFFFLAQHGGRYGNHCLFLTLPEM